MNPPKKFPTPRQKVFPEWATYCQSRHPSFKIYTNKGHATNAVSYKMPNVAIQLWHWNKDINEWELEIDFIPPDFCQECGNTLEVNIGTTHTFKAKHRYQFNYVVKGEKATPKYLCPIICKNCYDLHNREWSEKYRAWRNQKNANA